MARSRSVWGTAALAAGALVLAGCGTTGATKAGGSAEPVTLRLGTDDGDDAPTAAAIERFAERVRTLSDGALVIEPVYAAADTAGTTPRDWDQLVARKVSGGELEMGLIPARAWDVEGVLTLRPLSVPFLVESEEHLDAVVGGAIAADMLAGLGSEGVTGLALFPEGLRHLFSYGEPLTSPAALAGTTIRASHSATVWAVYEAWGAAPDDLIGEEFDEAASSGTVAGADSTFARSSGLPGGVPTVAGNLVTSVNAQTLVVSTEVLDGLDAEQGDVLRQAAVEVRDGILAEPLDEAADAVELCGRGGRVVTASESDLAALEAAVQPVVDQLEQDPTTAALIADIRELGSGLPAPEPVPACEPSGTTSSSAAMEPDTEGLFPEGTYRYHVTEAELVAAGMTPLDAENHAGIWDWTFIDGRVNSHDVRDVDGKVSEDEGSYCVLDGRVTVALSTDGCREQVLFHSTWTLEGRELRFTDAVPGDLGGDAVFAHALWGSEPLTRID